MSSQSKQSLSSQVEALLSIAATDVTHTKVAEVTRSSAKKEQSMHSPEAKGLLKLAGLVRQHSSTEPTYDDLEEFLRRM